MNKKTKALTTEQYRQIIQTMRVGFCGCRPNERIATALVLEGNLGLRISDIVRLHPCDIVRDGDRYRLEITEQKTGKRRVFTVPLIIAQYVENYCLRHGIGRQELIFPITERAVQKQLAIVCDYLGYEGISTHTASASGTPPRFIKPTAMILPLCSGFCSTAPPPLRSAISASSRSGSSRPFRTTRSCCRLLDRKNRGTA